MPTVLEVMCLANMTFSERRCCCMAKRIPSLVSYEVYEVTTPILSFPVESTDKWRMGWLAEQMAATREALRRKEYCLRLCGEGCSVWA